MTRLTSRFYFLLSIFSVEARAAVIASATAKASQNVNQRADTPVPTFTLGNTDLYIPAENAHEELEGESLMIWPTGIYEDIPPEGIDIAFGPELKQKIDTALKDNCQDENQIEDCTKEIAAVIDNTDLATHSKRYVGLLRALLGIITAWSLAVTWMQHQHTNNKEPPTVIHFDPDKVSQISSLATATLVAIATGDDDIVAGTATVGLVPQPTGGQHVSVTQLAQDEGEHKKGDILISIPDDLVPRLGDFLGKIGIDSTKEACEVPSESTKRDEELGKRVPPALDELTEECREALLGMTNALFEAGNDMMQQMQLAEPNNPFNPANNPEGAFVPMLAQGELRVLQEWARGRYRNRPGNPPGPLNNDQFGNLIARGAVALSIVWLYMLQSYANQVWWSEKQLTKSKLEEYKCPEEDPVCLDDVCKGEKTAFLTGKSEQLGYCTEGNIKACPCEKLADPFYYEVEPGWIEGQYEWLQELIDITEGNIGTLEPSCVTGGVRVKRGKEDFEKQIGAACRDHTLKRELVGPSGPEPGWEYIKENDNGFTWTLHWKDEGDCKFSCEDIFMEIAKNETCVSKDDMTPWASINTGCGDASMSVSEYQKPIDNEDWSQYRIEIYQESRPNGGSFIEWRVFAGYSDSIIEGPSRENTLQSPPFYVHMDVDTPDNFETSNIRFIIARTPNESDERRERFSSGTLAAPNAQRQFADAKAIFPFAYCGLVDQEWNKLPKNVEGSYRTITCYFQRNFDDIFNDDRCDREEVFCFYVGKGQ